MINVSEQLIATNKAQLDNAVEVANIAAVGAERLIELQTQTAKTVFSEFTQHLKSSANVKDFREWTELQTRAAQPVVDRATGYARDLYAVVSDTTTSFGKLVETQVGDLRRTVVNALDQLAKNAPAGSETTISIAKSAIAAANQAFDAATSASKQFSDATSVAVTATTKKSA